MDINVGWPKPKPLDVRIVIMSPTIGPSTNWTTCSFYSRINDSVEMKTEIEVDFSDAYRLETFPKYIK